ncbi:MAG: response regulator [Planctomycetota bacterium]|nr:response regulator [Planctomycetota bacterium]MDA1137300.1 response regulator [Planctomycetota bacterium]
MKKILVVEDSEFMNMLVCSTLQDEGFETVSAFDGEEGVRAAARETPDLIVMDIMMPVMDGFAATRALKESPKTRGIPVLMLTALNKVHDVIQVLGAGADGFLTKPFDGPTLVNRINHIIDVFPKMQAGETAGQAAIRDVAKKIAITEPRQQIFSAIFQSLNQVTHCKVFSVLVNRGEAEACTFLVTSQHAIPDLVIEQYKEQVVSIGERLLRSRRINPEIKTEYIYTADTNQSPKYAPPFRSTIHVPFYTEESNGILSIGTTERDAYSEDDFKFLFDLGSQIAPTLGRVTT